MIPGCRSPWPPGNRHGVSVLILDRTRVVTPRRSGAAAPRLKDLGLIVFYLPHGLPPAQTGPELGIGPAATRFATPGFEELVELDSLMSAEEHVRPMYVATTRARIHLVLSMRRPAKGAKTTASRIADYMTDRDGLQETLEIHEANASPEPQTTIGAGDLPAFDETLHSLE